MNTHDAVVDLAGVAAPLTLNASGVDSLFGIARFVDDADGLAMGVIERHDPLRPKQSSNSPRNFASFLPMFPISLTSMSILLPCYAIGREGVIDEDGPVS